MFAASPVCLEEALSRHKSAFCVNMKVKAAVSFVLNYRIIFYHNAVAAALTCWWQTEAVLCAE